MDRVNPDGSSYLSELRQFREAIARMGLAEKDGAGPQGVQVVYVGATRFEFDRHGAFTAMATPAQAKSRIVRRTG